MGIIHLSDRQRGVSFIVWDGEVTADDWLRHIKALVADPDWPAIPRFITDLRTVSDTSTIGVQEVNRITDVFGENLETFTRKTNAVVARDEFRRAKRFGELIERFGTFSVVFNSLDTACIFLGIDLEDTRQTIEELRFRLRANG
jgi:hypothetical protein